MQLDQWQAKKCTIIEVESNQIKYEGAHIIRVKRSLAKEDGSETGIVSIGLVCRYNSVTSNADTPPTWDIIHQYANISVDDLDKRLDTPENRILLEISTDHAFEHFEWCLVATVSQGFCAFIHLKLTVAFAGETRRIRVTWFGMPLFAFTYHGCEVVKFQNRSNEPIIPHPKPEYLAMLICMQ